jgi:hypothetical protein
MKVVPSSILLTISRKTIQSDWAEFKKEVERAKSSKLVVFFAWKDVRGLGVGRHGVHEYQRCR